MTSYKTHVTRKTVILQALCYKEVELDQGQILQLSWFRNQYPCISIPDCIVLYLNIYIVLLAVHTNQKCFQCERPREKRDRKEALDSQVNKVDRVEGGSWFQSAAPMIVKARVW